MSETEPILDYYEQIHPMFELDGKMMVMYFFGYEKTQYNIQFELWGI